MKSPEPQTRENIRTPEVNAFAIPLVVGVTGHRDLFAIRQGYAYATAEKEFIKQYEFMF